MKIQKKSNCPPLPLYVLFLQTGVITLFLFFLFQTRRIFEIGSFPKAVHIPVNSVKVRYIFEPHSERAVKQLRSIRADYKRLRRLAS